MDFTYGIESKFERNLPQHPGLGTSLHIVTPTSSYEAPCVIKVWAHREELRRLEPLLEEFLKAGAPECWSTLIQYCLSFASSFGTRIKWGGDINPLVPGWGTGPEKTRFPKCLGFALDWNLVFFCFLVLGWFLNFQIQPPEKIVYTSRFWTGKPNCCNDHIYHSHVSELLNLGFFNLKGRGVQGLIIACISV